MAGVAVPGLIAEPGPLVEALSAWFVEVARDLPWRRDPSPYAVLLSEVMLQQTRVDTVVPYFDRFLARWPTLEDLAAANDDEVLSAWAGLGYYSRARRLLATARSATALGGLPSTVEELLALPGIGPYTAGAVASLAFGRAVPVVDGNVERVVSRLDRRTEDPRREGRSAIWARVAALHTALGPPSDGAGRDPRPGVLNQALMELGATVCTPKRPRCTTCPVRAACLGREVAETLPNTARKAPPRKVRLLALVVRGEDGVLLARRPTEGLFGGLWEPPFAVLADGADPVLAASDLGADEPRTCGALVHVLTHRRLAVEVVAASGLRELPESWCAYVEERRAMGPGGLAISELARKVLELADRASSQPGLPLAASPSIE